MSLWSVFFYKDKIVLLTLFKPNFYFLKYASFYIKMLAISKRSTILIYQTDL